MSSAIAMESVPTASPLHDIEKASRIDGYGRSSRIASTASKLTENGNTNDCGVVVVWTVTGGMLPTFTVGVPEIDTVPDTGGKAPMLTVPVTGTVLVTATLPLTGTGWVVVLTTVTGAADADEASNPAATSVPAVPAIVRIRFIVNCPQVNDRCGGHAPGCPVSGQATRALKRASRHRPRLMMGVGSGEQHEPKGSYPGPMAVRRHEWALERPAGLGRGRPSEAGGGDRQQPELFRSLAKSVPWRKRGADWETGISAQLMIRTIYAACLLVGTFTHARTIWGHGLLWDYDGAPWVSCMFWTSLTVLDPVGAALLFSWPSTGLVMTAAIISVDVLHNAWYLLRSGLALTSSSTFMSQFAFLAFVSLTISSAWRGLKEDSLNRGTPITRAR